ncbi:MAG: hypothetical protein ACREJM_14590, partial [Candidatus Saccharimonadales bacterium]
ILVDNGDGTARAVSPAVATVANIISKIGIAEESNHDPGTKLVKAAIGTTASNAGLNLQQTADFSDLSVSGTAIVNTLTVTGSANIADLTAGNLTVAGTTTLAELHVLGDAKFDGATVSFSSNVRGIDLPVKPDKSSVSVNFGTPHPDADYAVQCTPSYNTTCYVTGKTARGFIIHFGKSPPNDKQTVDWFVVR